MKIEDRVRAITVEKTGTFLSIGAGAGISSIDYPGEKGVSPVPKKGERKMGRGETGGMKMVSRRSGALGSERGGGSFRGLRKGKRGASNRLLKKPWKRAHWGK